MAPRSHHSTGNSQDIVCKNRFEVLTDLEECNVENLCNQLQDNSYCNTPAKKTHSMQSKRVQYDNKAIHKDKWRTVNADGFKGNNLIKSEGEKHTCLNSRGDAFGKIDGKNGNGNNHCDAIDYTDTDFIVTSTLHGKSYIKKVNVYKLDKKCEDLTNCLQ